MNSCLILVVTYNRKKLLEENISSLIHQNYSDFDILIVDNNSTDGTGDFVKSINNEKINYINTHKNLGGAGGFSIGIEYAIKNNYKYVWIMDDDAIPYKEALNSLISKSKILNDDFSFIASLVYWTDGNIFPMNAPNCNYKSVKDVRYDLISKFKIVPIKYCSFVGCFVNLSKVSQCGLPISEFFIYGDDLEYTERIRKIAPAYLDLDSIIIHKAPSNKGANIVYNNYDRLNRFYYQFRNKVYLQKKKNKFTILFKVWFIIAKSSAKVLLYAKDHKFKRISIIIKGSISGLFFNPKIKYVNKEE